MSDGYELSNLPIGQRVKIATSSCPNHNGKTGTVVSHQDNGTTGVLIDGTDQTCFPFAVEPLLGEPEIGDPEPTEAPAEPQPQASGLTRPALIAIMNTSAQLIIAAGAAASSMITNTRITPPELAAEAWAEYAEGFLDWHIAKMDELSEAINEAINNA